MAKRRWLWISAVAGGYLLRRAIRRFLPAFRRLGHRAHRVLDQELKLDEALRESFPASDSPAVSSTGSEKTS